MADGSAQSAPLTGRATLVTSSRRILAGLAVDSHTAM